MGRWDDDKSPPNSRKRKRERDQEGGPRKKRKQELDSQQQWGKKETQTEESTEPEVEQEKPNFELSGLLAKEANKNESGTVMKYAEPRNARKPKQKWRLHVFKNEDALSVIPLHNDSFHLFGRDRNVVHIATDHPSCSSQHAVIQFRSVPLLDDLGLPTGKNVVKPYLMDLESTNGTELNGKKIKPARYVELVLGDCIKFAFSSREYVVLYEEAAQQ